MHRARALWLGVETIHAVTYFGEESRVAAKECGLRGFWMGYFGFRAAPLGAASAEAVGTAFYNFAPSMVSRSIPDAWSYAEPTLLIEARVAAAATTLRRVSGGALAAATDLSPLLNRLARQGRVLDAPLYAANRDLPERVDPVEALWAACTTLREHRGDAHVAALRAAGISGCQAHQLLAAEQRVPTELLRENRGWSNEDWQQSAAELVGRGLLDSAAELTAAGRLKRDDVERATDLAAQELWASTGDDLLDLVTATLAPLAEKVAASGAIPFPNPMGLPDITRVGLT